jgi:acetyltransferase-like isoleucine patch superfamily enzyme
MAPERRDLDVHSPEARQMFRRVPEAIALTERLNRLPYADQDGIRAVWAELTGRPAPTLRLIPPFRCEHGLHIRVGEDVFLNQDCTLMDMGGIEIGDGTMLGPGVKLISSGHGLAPADRKKRITMAPIVLGRNVWVCAGATILHGVTVGDDAVVAAGAVVTEDVPAGVVVAGVPARVVRDLDEDPRA